MKHVLYFLAFIGFISLSFFSIAQPCFDAIAEQQIPENPHELGSKSSEFLDFMEKTNCFLGDELDSIDLEITLDQNYLKVLLTLEKIENNEPISYRRLKEILVEVVREGEFEKTRKLHLLTRDFNRKKAVYENWEEDKQILLSFGIPEDRLEPFKNYLKDHPKTGKTYEELMMEFEKSKATIQRKE